MCEHVFVAIEWTEEDCRPSIKQTIEGFFFFMHSKVEDQVSGTWSWTLFHSHHFILVSSEKSRRGHSCWLHPEPFLFRTSLPTGLHESQRGVWESAPPCPLSKMPHSYFHSLHNNWLHGVLSRKSFLVSGAAEVLRRQGEIPPGVGKSQSYAIKRTKQWSLAVLMIISVTFQKEARATA